MNEFVKEIASAMKESKTKAYDTVAKVLRIDEKTAYVHIDGGADETPAQMAINCKTGDTVKIRVSGGKAWITGNITAPPTDDSAAEVAQTAVKAVAKSYGKFASLTTENFKAVNADIEKLNTKKLDAESADIKFANIDFSNIGKAAMEYFYAQSGLIKDVVVGDQKITGHLIGVTISGDLIEGNTVKAEKLVVLGEDGLYYKLNVNALGEAVASSDAKYQNGLDGSVIIAKSVTAEKVSVKDLVAFGATIGGLNITDGSLYSGVKDSINNTTQGFYVDKNGQLYLGDAKNFLRYYKAKDGTYKLAISAKSVTFGTNQNLEEAWEETKTSIESKIETVDVEYYLSTSATSLSGGSWSTTAPAWTDGKYMWMRTKITDGAGNITYSPDENGTCIAGATGATGATGSSGKGIASIVEEYYQSTSATSLSGGSWSTVVPTWVDGKYIWTRSVITYTDTTVKRTEGICATGQKGATGAQGADGRNAMYITVSGTNYDTAGNATATTSYIIINGTKYSFSPGRGHALAVINPSNSTVESIKSYDTYTVSDLLEEPLNAVETGKIICLFTADASGLSSGTRKILLECGSAMTNTWDAIRATHVFIGMKGLAKGNAYEAFATGNSGTRVITAYYTSSGIVLNGQVGDTGPQGIKGDTGDIGPQGPPGVKGEDGLNGTNLWINPLFDTDKPQITTIVDGVTAPNGSKVNIIKDRDNYNNSTGFPVFPDHTYTIYVDRKRISGDLELHASIWYLEMSSGHTWDSYNISPRYTSAISDGWEKAVYDVTVPEGKRKGCIYFQIEQDDNGGTKWYVANISCIDVTAISEAKQEAAKTATNFMKYEDGTGLIVGDMRGDTLGQNTLLDSSGMAVRNGNSEIVRFGTAPIVITNTDGDKTYEDSGSVMKSGNNIVVATQQTNSDDVHGGGKAALEMYYDKNKDNIGLSLTVKKGSTYTDLYETIGTGLYADNDYTILNGDTIQLNAYNIIQLYSNAYTELQSESIKITSRKVKCTLGVNNILWDANTIGYWMNASHKFTLNEPISEQLTGAVFVWSHYSNGACDNWWWTSFFVPKQHVAWGPGDGMLMCNPYYGLNKYIYIGDTFIQGADVNQSNNAQNGIAVNNQGFVLRYVLGV